MSMFRRLLPGVALALSGLLAGPAQASIIINVNQVGSDVVFSFSGSLDLASTLFKEADRNTQLHDVSPTTSFIRSMSGSADDYNLNLTANPAFGANFYTENGISTGDNLLLESSGFDQIWVRDGYVSGELMSGTMTFLGETFATMGLFNGTYTWTWENNGVGDFAQINIGAATVPEPTTLALLGLAIVGAGFASRRKRA